MQENTDAGFTVHVLFLGFAMCGRFADRVPRDWPRGHTWVGRAEYLKATCTRCKEEAGKL